MSALIAASRPRFWLYLLGPALVGIAVSDQPLMHATDIRILFLILIWTLPANLFLYGVNDLMDGDTDEFNEKKEGYEQRVSASVRTRLFVAVCLCGAITLCAVFLTGSFVSRLAIILFVILGFTYSAPPTRWKARFGLDSLSNVLYIMPGIALAAACGQSIMPLAVLGAWSWASAMHLFSAIPDIQADTQAKLRTTAVVLGAPRSLLLCAVLWAISVINVFWFFGIHPLSIAALGYVVLPLVLLTSKRQTIFAVYRWMPCINAIVGFVLFLSVVLR